MTKKTGFLHPPLRRPKFVSSQQTISPKTLYIVATPIGNLEDISARALSVLEQVDFILCEDTRHSGILLDRYQIKKRLMSYFAHSEALRTEQFLPQLCEGRSAALITDAGTPGISDPGSRLVDACHAAGVSVCPIPGPSAVIAAVSACGFDSTSFRFIAFFPRKSGERQACFQSLLKDKGLLVGYESPRRIQSLLTDLIAVVGPDRRVCFARELTKKFESIERTTAGALLEKLSGDVKGEICLVIEGAPVKAVADEALPEEAQQLLDLLLKTELSSRDIRDIVSKQYELKPSLVYAFVLKARQ